MARRAAIREGVFMAASIVRRPGARCLFPAGWLPMQDPSLAPPLARGPRVRAPWRQYERRLRIEPISEVRIDVELLPER